MKKILVVEDDRVLSKVIEKKVKAIGFIPFLAPTMKAAENFIESEEFFAAMLDLNLPDAPNGEVVDFVLEKKIPSIVLTSLYDNDTRISMSKKSIVDYVIKNREESIDYAVHIIKRIHHYKDTKALIVEDSAPQRLFIKRMMEALLFQTFEAENGVEALKVFEEHPDIKLVLTDFHMPEMDGFELTLKLRRDYKEDQLAIVALTAHDSKDTSAKFLKFGASDYLAKPFTREEFNYRINKKMDILEMVEEIKDYAEQLEIANESIRHANTAKLKYIQTIEEYLDIIDRHVLISKTDLEGNITYASNAFLKLMGFEWMELVGQNHRVMKHPEMPEDVFKEMWGTISEKKTWNGDVKNKKKNGDIVWLQSTISPIIDDKKEHVGYVAIRNNLTDKILAQKLVVTDPLTKTYNRMKLDSTIKLEIERLRRYGDSLSMIFIDVDHFKEINESKGHHIGDKILLQLAKFIQKRCRLMDIFGRWAGEEFAIICVKTDLPGAMILAERIHEDMALENWEEGVSVSCSIAVSQCRADEGKADFVKRIDALLQKAKQNGRNRIESE